MNITKVYKGYTWKLVYLCIFLFLISIASAVPPVTQVQQFTTGYVIQIPQDVYLKLGADYQFDFHVFNISNGVPVTNGVVCAFHLYNQSGTHTALVARANTSAIYDYTFDVSSGNFTNIGSYYYHVNCNSSMLGGYSGAEIVVTNNGEANPEGIIVITYQIIFLVLMVFMIYLFIHTLGHGIKKDFDLVDLGFDYGFYFALLAFSVFESQYVVGPMVTTILDFLIYICAFTHIFVPTIMFIISMIKNGMETNRRESEYS